MGIEQFLKSQSKSKVEQFQQASIGKTKEEVRKLEVQLLKPAALPPSTMENTAHSDLDNRTVMIVFPNQDSVALFQKHFPTLTSGGVNNLGRHSTRRLLALLEAIDSGRIQYDYDKETGGYTARSGDN